jgi:hypothetical protein
MLMMRRCVFKAPTTPFDKRARAVENWVVPASAPKARVANVEVPPGGLSLCGRSGWRLSAGQGHTRRPRHRDRHSRRNGGRKPLWQAAPWWPTAGAVTLANGSLPRPTQPKWRGLWGERGGGSLATAALPQNVAAWKRLPRTGNAPLRHSRQRRPMTEANDCSVALGRPTRPRSPRTSAASLPTAAGGGPCLRICM